MKHQQQSVPQPGFFNGERGGGGAKARERVSKRRVSPSHSREICRNLLKSKWHLGRLCVVAQTNALLFPCFFTLRSTGGEGGWPLVPPPPLCYASDDKTKRTQQCRKKFGTHINMQITHTHTSQFFFITLSKRLFLLFLSSSLDKMSFHQSCLLINHLINQHINKYHNQSIKLQINS